MKKFRWETQCPYGCYHKHIHETDTHYLNFDGGCPKKHQMIMGWRETRMAKMVAKAWNSHKWTKGNEINWCINCGINPITANLWSQQNGDPDFCSNRLKGVKKDYCPNSFNHTNRDDYFKSTGYYPVRCECNTAWRGISV